MFIEIAVGDAYGYKFEFSPYEKIEEFNSGDKYPSHGDIRTKIGRYSDDTQMSIAIAEMLLNDVEFTPLNCANAFVDVFHRDVRSGYAGRFRGLMFTCKTGAELLSKIEPVSVRNGAAMRSVPLGLIPDEKEMLLAAETQACVTHNTPEGIISSQIIALVAHHLIYKKIPLDKIPELTKDVLGFTINTEWNDFVRCDAIDTAHAVLAMLLKVRNMHELLVNCVNLGGDVDSVASIALGLASLSPEYENNIATDLVSALENGYYGFDFLMELEAKLKAKYPELPLFRSYVR